MNKKLFFLSALFGAVMLFGSCAETDPCKDVDCGANGTCFEGDCICDVGYQQDANGQCSVRTVDLFAGQYSVAEDCSASAPASYTVTIVEKSISSIGIINFWGLFSNQVSADIDDDNNITISRQEPDGDKFFVEGSGTLSVGSNGKSVITLTYRVTDETDPANIGTDICSNTVFIEI